jgi:hypothetical protein
LPFSFVTDSSLDATGRTKFSTARRFASSVSFSGEYGIGGFGPQATCDFRHARFEIPNRVSFHSVTLRPYWLIDLDPQKFEFVDVNWIGNLRRKFIDIELKELKKREESEAKEAAEKKAEWLKNADQYGDKFELERLRREIAADSKDKANEPLHRKTRNHRLLSITCRQLAVNAEENHRYDEASEFRFWSMELRRREGWRARGRLSVGILHALYRYLSGYGEEIGRAFAILLGLWLFFAVLYTQVGFVHTNSPSEAATYQADEVGAPQKLPKSLAYSLEVMTLQQPNPRPLTAAARFAVLAERILGPIQAALFALAIRRRFMR